MKIMRYLVAVIFLSLISLGGAVRAQSSSIVDLEYVKSAQQRGVIIWDVRASNQYLEGHIPGAINFGDIGTVLRDPNREDFIDLAEINAIFNNMMVRKQRSLSLVSIALEVDRKCSPDRPLIL